MLLIRIDALSMFRDENQRLWRRYSIFRRKYFVLRKNTLISDSNLDYPDNIASQRQIVKIDLEKTSPTVLSNNSKEGMSERFRHLSTFF